MYGYRQTFKAKSNLRKSLLISISFDWRLRRIYYFYALMFEWATVLILIFLGVALILVELIFVPGTTIVGLLGVGLCVVGVYFGFQYFGGTTGWIIVAGTAVVGFGSIVIGLRSGSWKRFALKRSMDSHVNEDVKVDIKEGDIGETVSALRPIGKAEFNGQFVEVRTVGDYIESSKKVKVIRISDNKIIGKLNTEQ